MPLGDSAPASLR